MSNNADDLKIPFFTLAIFFFYKSISLSYLFEVVYNINHQMLRLTSYPVGNVKL